MTEENPSWLAGTADIPPITLHPDVLAGDQAPDTAAPAEEPAEEPAEGSEGEQQLAVVTEMPKRSVLMSAAGRTVQVDGPDDLDVLVGCAERLWAVTDDPKIVRGHGATGFFTETAPTDRAAYAPDDDRARRLLPPGFAA